MWFDVLVSNVDRHNENLGLLRDKRSGKIISLAPNYDNNMCLYAVHRELYPTRKNDDLLKIFKTFIKNNENAKGVFKEMGLPKPESEMIKSILSDSTIPMDTSDLCDYIINAYNDLDTFKKSL